MRRRQTFLLLLVLCVFASFVSASSIEFLDEWGETTSRVLEQSRVLLRVIDPAADTTPGRDSVSVDLSAVNGPDTATVALEETAGGTGVFEGEAFLTTDYALDNIYGVDADQLYTTWVYPGPTMDTATATYGAQSDSVEVGLTEARFVDAEGRGTDFVVAGAPLHVRVRDVYEDLSAGPDFTTATLTTSDGDSEAVTLTETGARTRAYLGSLPVVLGTPVVGDGRIQSAHGETITVHIPMTFVKRGGRKLVVEPDGTEWAPRPRVDNAMVKALARAFRWRKMLGTGVHATLEDLARAKGVNATYVSRSAVHGKRSADPLHCET